MKQITLRHLATQYRVYEGSGGRPLKQMSCYFVTGFICHL